MFNLKLQNIHFTDCAMKMVPGYMAFQGHLWVMQMRMPIDSPENYSQSSRVGAGVSAKMLAACLLHSSVEHLPPTLARALFFFFCFINRMKIWMEILTLSILPSNQETTKLYTFLFACNSNGEKFHRGWNSDNLLYFWAIRPACSWHVLVIQSEETPAKMHFLENLVGGLLPLYSKSQNYKDFLLNC